MEVQRFKGHSGDYVLRGGFFIPMGISSILTGSGDNTARLWDLSSGEEVQRFEGHSGDVRAVAFHPNGNQLLTGSSDNTARLWDLSSGERSPTSGPYYHRDHGQELGPIADESLSSAMGHSLSVPRSVGLLPPMIDPTSGPYCQRIR